MPSDLAVPGGFDLTSIAPPSTRTLRCWCYTTIALSYTVDGVLTWDRTTPEVAWQEATTIIFEPIDRQGLFIGGPGMIQCGDVACSRMYGGTNSPIQLLRQVIAA